MTLNLEARDVIHGQTIGEYIQTVAGELPVDAVGLWQIVPAGRQGFGLKDSDLSEFVRRCIRKLLESGAKPVRGGAGTDFDWIIQSQYGNSDEEIADSVMAEWISGGQADDDPGGLWFALPSPFVGSI